MLVRMRIKEPSFLHGRELHDAFVGSNCHSNPSPRSVVTSDSNHVIQWAGVLNVFCHLRITLGYVVIPFGTVEITREQININIKSKWFLELGYDLR